MSSVIKEWAEDGSPVFDIQALIDTGQAWMLEGSVGRACMAAIEDGAAVLGMRPHFDYYRNRVPSRFEVAPGSLGSQLYAHEQQGHEREYARCRAGTCKLPRRLPRQVS